MHALQFSLPSPLSLPPSSLSLSHTPLLFLAHQPFDLRKPIKKKVPPSHICAFISLRVTEVSAGDDFILKAVSNHKRQEATVSHLT